MTAVRNRPAGSWLAFVALAVYGTMRWATMLPASDQGRMFAALMLAFLGAAVLRRLPGGRYRSWVVAVLALLGVGLGLLIAGFPLHWLLALRVHRLVIAFEDGLSSLPGVLVPYRGDDTFTIAVIVLGAAVLLLSAGLLFGCVAAGPSTGRLALTAVPLLVLAVVPSVIVAPGLIYFHGLVTFTLVALLVFSPRLAPERRAAAWGLLCAAAIMGAITAGLIAGSHLWVRVGTGASVGTGTGTAEQFNWAQTYGPLGPRSNATVLTIRARRPAYWKAEDLDDFNGVQWTTGPSAGDPGLAGVSHARLTAGSETLSVDVHQLLSPLVIGAGYSDAPDDVSGAVPGNDPGTWTTYILLQAGDHYTIGVYAPEPTAAQLAAAGRAYPASLAPFRTVGKLPNAYAEVEALAAHLAGTARNPYADVESVLDDLRHGYVYTLDPPAGGSDPLVDFLLHSKRGYCQQFAGAMALLLRMEGIPARVAVGFSTGTRQHDSDTYVVTGKDAHAWVEVWFPHWGWVTFDPTPGTAAGGGAEAATTAPQGAGTGASTSHAGTLLGAGNARLHLQRAGRDAGTRTSIGHRHARKGGGVLWRSLLVMIAAVWLALFVVGIRSFRRRLSPAELTAELERAFARCGQPLASTVTLAALERRLRDSPEAAAYVAALAEARFGTGAVSPTATGRAALRRWLVRRSGPAGWLRAVWALPPRRAVGAP